MGFYFYDDDIHPVKDALPCPICGKSDALSMSSAKRWNKLIKENDGACLVIDCKRCGLEMREYDHIINSKKYADVKKALLKKWNERRSSDESEEN